MADRVQTRATPVTVSASVAERLRNEIREGRLKPGARLRQAHIAEEYGVSTTPVREAFVALEREGLVQGNAHRGVIVFEPTVADLREIYEIRIPLEALATELAVRNLTEKELSELEKLVPAIPNAGRRRNVARGRDLNEEFHARIYAAAQRPRLFGLIAEMRASSRAYTGIFSTFRSLIDESEHEHRDIYDALRARAPKKASRAMVAHLEHTVDAVASELES